MKRLLAVIVLVGALGAGLYIIKQTGGADPREAPAREDCVALQVHIAELSQSDALAAMSPDQRRAMLDEIARKALAENSKITEQCLTGDKATIDCMIAAGDMDTLQACIPR